MPGGGGKRAIAGACPPRPAAATGYLYNAAAMGPIRPSPTGMGTGTAHGPSAGIVDPGGQVPTNRAEARSADSAGQGRSGTPRSVWPYVIAGSVYLLLSLFMWLHVWTGRPSSVTTCGCGDTSATIWYMQWPAYAMLHGLNPLYSTAIGYPTGVNLVFAAYGIVMAPVTWLFGPVTAVNVVLTVSPVLSAVAMFALVRRWVSWMPAAFLAGLFYGFSPFVVSNLGVAHVDFIMIAIPPLVVLCLDELLIRQDRRPAVVGIVMGLLISAQFFVGVEMLTLTIIEAGIGIIMITIYTAVRSPATLREHAGHAATGGVVAAFTAVVLLAFPAWFALAGPAYFPAVTHPGVQLTGFSASIANAVFPLPTLKDMPWQHIVGAYQGPMLSSQYFGMGVILVCLGGLIVWRKDRILWLFGVLSVVTLLLATSSGPLLSKLPLLKNVYLLHFVVFVYLAVAIVLALIVDHTRSAIRQLGESTNVASNGRTSRWRKPLYSWGGALAALMVAVVAMAPPAAYVAESVPMTVEAVVVPTWFRAVAPRLPGHPVILALPAPFTTTSPGVTWETNAGQRYLLADGWKQAALTWHALTGQEYSIVGTGGLGVGVKHDAGEDQGQNIITKVTFAYGSSPHVTSSDIVAVHRALSEWGVTMVVLPDQPEMPSYDRVASVTAMAALISAATGARPTHVAQAWVWRAINHDNPQAYPDAAQYARCTSGVPTSGVIAVQRTTACVLSPL